MNNTGIILTLAYPDTIVRISDEKFVPYLRYLNIGCKDFVRAGHAALVLINKKTGSLEYFDFGRYTSPEGFGRVRGKITDNELEFPIQAKVEQGKLQNLEELLEFLATHPKLTHGEGKLVASICTLIDYDKAMRFILNLQQQDFVRYGAFIKKGSNCSRFVTDTLIKSITDTHKKKQLLKSKWFTPSTVGNVVIANTAPFVYEVSQEGIVTEFKSTVKAENRRCFLDKLDNFKPNLDGNLKPKYIDVTGDKAQWLEGVGAGAWFELFKTSEENTYQYRRISPYGNIDVDAYFTLDNLSFDYNKPYQFVHFSNCSFFHIKQHETVYRFERIKKFS